MGSTRSLSWFIEVGGVCGNRVLREVIALNVFCYTDGADSNFGDDLNRWLWKRICGCDLDTDDGTLLLGIGTIISRNLIPLDKRYIVLSSGVGYAPIPLSFGGPEWEILSVRGPLTAAVLGLPPDKAIIDGAALLRLIPECEPLPESERAGIVFMPHFATLATGNWRRVCEMAGFEFLDPFVDSEATVQRIRKAKLVIADAMHAAIVADTLRVPWIPVSLSPQSNTFKWLDWTLSLGLPLQPHVAASVYPSRIRPLQVVSLLCREAFSRESRSGKCARTLPAHDTAEVAETLAVLEVASAAAYLLPSLSES